jgi:hypothetical protein
MTSIARMRTCHVARVTAIALAIVAVPSVVLRAVAGTGGLESETTHGTTRAVVLALVSIVIGGLMFIRRGRQATDQWHRLRRGTGALRGAVPGVVVLTAVGQVMLCPPRICRRTDPSTDRSTDR